VRLLSAFRFLWLCYKVNRGTSVDLATSTAVPQVGTALLASTSLTARYSVVISRGGGVFIS
jgi:hypothetical protein